MFEKFPASQLFWRCVYLCCFGVIIFAEIEGIYRANVQEHNLYIILDVLSKQIERDQKLIDRNYQEISETHQHDVDSYWSVSNTLLTLEGELELALEEIRNMNDPTLHFPSPTPTPPKTK